VDCLADETLTRRLCEGISDNGDFLSAKRASVLRQGTRHSWLELVLAEGKNRHIRRLLSALEVGVLRLVRVAIGPLQLGALTKGDSRLLTGEEAAALARTRQP
jgi:23S rRNA pseudouridine2605 synthase